MKSNGKHTAGHGIPYIEAQKIAIDLDNQAECHKAETTEEYLTSNDALGPKEDPMHISEHGDGHETVSGILQMEDFDMDAWVIEDSADIND